MGALLPMKTLLLQPRVRLALLLTVLAGVLLLNLIAPPAANLPTTLNNTRQAALGRAMGSDEMQPSRAKWEPFGEDIFVDTVVTAPPNLPVQALEPPTPSEPPSVSQTAPEPVAPPLPYVVMARFQSGGKS